MSHLNTDQCPPASDDTTEHSDNQDSAPLSVNQTGGWPYGSQWSFTRPRVGYGHQAPIENTVNSQQGIVTYLGHYSQEQVNQLIHDLRYKRNDITYPGRQRSLEPEFNDFSPSMNIQWPVNSISNPSSLVTRMALAAAEQAPLMVDSPLFRFRICNMRYNPGPEVRTEADGPLIGSHIFKVDDMPQSEGMRGLKDIDEVCRELPGEDRPLSMPKLDLNGDESDDVDGSASISSDDSLYI